MRHHPVAVVVFTVVATFGTIMSAQTPSVTTQARNKATIARSFAAWSAGAGSPYDLLADTASWTIVGRSAASKTYESRDAFMRDVIRPFNARMSTRLRPEIRRVYADGDTVIVFFDARGIARDGKPYENTYAWFLTMQDDKVIKAFTFFDSVEFNELWSCVSVP